MGVHELEHFLKHNLKHAVKVVSLEEEIAKFTK